MEKYTKLTVMLHYRFTYSCLHFNYTIKICWIAKWVKKKAKLVNWEFRIVNFIEHERKVKQEEKSKLVMA